MGGVKEEIELLGRIVANLFVEIEQPAIGIAFPSPGTRGECREVYYVFIVEAFVEVDQFVDVEVGNRAEAAAAGAAAGWVVKRERVGIADERFADSREEKSEQGVDVGIGTHG